MSAAERIQRIVDNAQPVARVYGSRAVRERGWRCPTCGNWQAMQYGERVPCAERECRKAVRAEETA